MICKNCNTENQEDSLFCNKCGANISDQSNENRNQEQSNNKLNFFKNKKTIILISAVAVIACSTLVFLYLNNPLKNYQNEIKNNNYSEASDIYDEAIKGNDEKEIQVKSFLLDEITEIENSFMDKKIEYSKATDRLGTIKNTGLVSKEVKTAVANIENMNKSRIAYKKAKEFQKEDNYIDAIREYKNVIKEDENYKSAQEQIEDMATDYKNDVLKQAEESAKSQDYDKSVTLLKEASSLVPDDNDIVAKLAVYEKKLEEKKATERKQKVEKAKSEQLVIVESSRIVAQSSEFKTLYPDMIQVIAKNNSEKTIKKMEVGSLGYDNNGYPIKIKTQFAFSGGDYEFVGIAEDVNIVTGARFGENVGWELDEQHGITTVLSCVKNVTFYDGTTWNNPYYQYWIEEHKEKPLN